MPPIAIIGFIIIGSMPPIAPLMAPIMLGSIPIEVLFIPAALLVLRRCVEARTS